MDLLAYAATFVLCSLYAVVLERLGKAYEPRWTWLTVVVGVATALERIQRLMIEAKVGAE